MCPITVSWMFQNTHKHGKGFKKFLRKEFVCFKEKVCIPAFRRKGRDYDRDSCISRLARGSWCDVKVGEVLAVTKREVIWIYDRKNMVPSKKILVEFSNSEVSLPVYEFQPCLRITN